jgi:hypothetical protein
MQDPLVRIKVVTRSGINHHGRGLLRKISDLIERFLTYLVGELAKKSSETI